MTSFEIVYTVMNIFLLTVGLKCLHIIYKHLFTTRGEINDTLPPYNIILALDRRVSRLEKQTKGEIK